MPRNEEIIVGLDIGTTKVASVVGEITPEGGIDIIGVGQQPSRGMRRGVVINIESTVASVMRAVEDAELMAGCQIGSVYVNISGSHIQGQNSNGVVGLKEREVKDADIQRVIDAAKAVHIPPDREVIHILPQDFVIDDQGGIKTPLGMSGVRLQSNVHIVTAAQNRAQDTIRCCNAARLKVASMVLSPLASSYAVLSDEERELGVAVVDLGGGATDMAIFKDGALVHSAVLPLGGNQLTNDIAVGLRTPAADAERIKRKHGCAYSGMVSKDETIEVPSVGGRQPRVLARQILCEIIEPRVEEIFQLVCNEIERSGNRDTLASGVVITGGSVLMDGMPEMAEEMIGMPVRRGSPVGVGGLVDVVRTSPHYSTAVGLVIYGSQHASEHGSNSGDNGFLVSIGRRIRSLFKEII
ncbi:MAG: Cell division protein FtsA [Myxococcota bacterium]|nr:Cell division protein FtsA [Myxococcota bacterium]